MKVFDERAWASQCERPEAAQCPADPHEAAVETQMDHLVQHRRRSGSPVPGAVGVPNRPERGRNLARLRRHSAEVVVVRQVDAGLPAQEVVRSVDSGIKRSVDICRFAREVLGDSCHGLHQGLQASDDGGWVL